ncbi:hypothetical protein [Ornithinimicrobium kibberense]
MSWGEGTPTSSGRGGAGTGYAVDAGVRSGRRSAGSSAGRPRP